MEYFNNQIPILTFHNISQRRDWGINTIPPERFRTHLQFLKNQGYVPINFLNLAHQKLPRNPIIITFDDGYASVFENAFPILQEFGFTAVVFVVTGYIGKWNEWDVNLGGIRSRHLNASQIKKLSESGIEIGTHGTSHYAFTYMTQQKLENELYESKKTIEKIIKRRVVSLAYPFGIQNQKIQQNVEEAGYTFACVNLNGHNGTNNPYCLKRYPVYRTDSIFALKNKLLPGIGNSFEIAKLRLLSWPAILTPVFQKYFFKELNFRMNKHKT